MSVLTREAEIGSHAVFMIICPKDAPVRERKFASFVYTLKRPEKGDEVTQRLPVETGRIGETISDTAKRGLVEEIIEAGTEFKFEFLKVGGRVKPIYVSLSPDQDDNTKLHLQIGLIMHFDGNLRKIPFEEPGPKGVEHHAVPRFMSSKNIELEMRRLGTKWSHRNALANALKFLDAPDRFNAFRDIVSGDQVTAVEGYMKWNFE